MDEQRNEKQAQINGLKNLLEQSDHDILEAIESVFACDTAGRPAGHHRRREIHRRHRQAARGVAQGDSPPDRRNRSRERRLDGSAASEPGSIPGNGLLLDVRPRHHRGMRLLRADYQQWLKTRIEGQKAHRPDYRELHCGHKQQLRSPAEQLRSPARQPRRPRQDGRHHREHDRASDLRFQEQNASLSRIEHEIHR